MTDRSPRRTPVLAPETGTVSPRELLAEHFAGTSARVVGTGRRTLATRGMQFATVGPDPAMITPMCAVSARDLPVIDVLAGVASQDPSGVLLIETADDAFAFEVSQGRITGARGIGPLDQLELFVAEVHRRHPQRFGSDEAIGRDQPAWMKVARMFVEERVLDQLTLSRMPGTRMTLIRGDIEWQGTRLPEGVGPTLGHVLLEHARRFDEMPKLITSLGDLDRLAIPIAEPTDRPLRRAGSGGASDWDFFDDPDPAAIAEWNDAVAVFSLCDGESSLREIIDAAMLGHFRGLLALRTLTSARCIVLIEPLATPTSQERATVPRAEVIPLHVAPTESYQELVVSRTGYSIVARRSTERGSRARGEVDNVRRPTPPVWSPPRRPPPAPVPRASVSSGSASAVPELMPRSGTLEIETNVIDAIADAPSDETGTPQAARSLVAARAPGSALPSPATVMLVLGAMGLVALAASFATLL